MFGRACAVLAVGVLAATPVPAQDGRANIGTLTCTLQNGGDGSVTTKGQTRDMSCAFQPTQGSGEERYTGTIRKVGGSQSLSGKLVLVWSVTGSPQKQSAPGFLEQTYTGDETDGKATPPPGLLSGERDQSLALLPLTNNAAAQTPATDITVIDLKYAAVRT